ncbi:MAG: hypothetical protein U1G07_05660 [Verrucomicrobiota bacterium]
MFTKRVVDPPQDSFPHFAPFGSSQIAQGEEVRILPLDGPRPLTVDFVPVRYAELEQVIVPAEVRAWPSYGKYQLSAPTARTVWPEEGSDFFIDCFVRIASVTGGP